MLSLDEADRPVLERQQARPARHLSVAAAPGRSQAGAGHAGTLPRRDDGQSGRASRQLGSLSRPQHCLLRGRRQRRHHRFRFQPQRLLPQFRRACRIAHGAAPLQPHRRVRRLEDRQEGQRQAAHRLAQRRHALYDAGILRAVLGRDVTRRRQADRLHAERLHRLQDW